MLGLLFTEWHYYSSFVETFIQTISLGISSPSSSLTCPHVINFFCDSLKSLVDGSVGRSGEAMLF